jgi:hypothetical protein
MLTTTLDSRELKFLIRQIDEYIEVAEFMTTAPFCSHSAVQHIGHEHHPQNASLSDGSTHVERGHIPWAIDAAPGSENTRYESTVPDNHLQHP